MSSPITVAGNNLSEVWGRAFLLVFRTAEISPLVVQINEIDNQEVGEIPLIRDILDVTLRRHAKGLSCHQVANTIFPDSLWDPQVHRKELYLRYQRICPQILRHRQNRNGVYFQRLISFPDGTCNNNGVNQLEHIIKTWWRGNHRRSALQAAIFDPCTDHSHQRQRGFPCLQQVAFAPVNNGGLSVTGFYATQYIFERAYGNYLGLCRLGKFMAHEMHLSLDRVTCIASVALRSRARKGVLMDLEQHVRLALKGKQSDVAIP